MKEVERHIADGMLCVVYIYFISAFAGLAPGPDDMAESPE